MLNRDEEHTHQIVSYIKEKLVDPFAVGSQATPLMNISTGLVAIPDINSALTSAVEKGKDMLNAFVTTSFRDEKEKTFHFPTNNQVGAENSQGHEDKCNGRWYKQRN